MQVVLEFLRVFNMQKIKFSHEGQPQGQTPVSGEQVQKPFQGYELIPPFVRCTEILKTKEEEKESKDGQKKDDTLPGDKGVKGLKEGQNQGCARRGDSK